MKTKELPVIVVDDEYWTAKRTAGYVKARGFENVAVFECPIKVKGLIDESDSPFVIVTDYVMPGMSGLQLLRSVCTPGYVEGLVMSSVPEMVKCTEFKVFGKCEKGFLSELADHAVRLAGKIALANPNLFLEDDNCGEQTQDYEFLHCRNGQYGQICAKLREAEEKISDFVGIMN